MIVVDRSGSVQRAHGGPEIQRALTEFLDAAPNGKPLLDETRDVIGLGSFGGSWKLDFPPATMFRSGALAQAIQKIPFEAAATNTSEALYRAYEQLRVLNRVNSVNVILLITDGRPNALSVTYGPNAACGWDQPRTGFIAATVGRAWPPLPPVTYGENNIYTMGLFKSEWTGWDLTLVEGAGCHYYIDASQPVPGAFFYKDVSSFPETDAHGNSTIGPNPLEYLDISSPRAIRFAALNAADNMATTIRSDRVLRPLIVVVGIHQPIIEESVDPAWLASVANDITFKDSSGKFVLRPQETPERYLDVSGKLDTALKDAAAFIARVAALRDAPETNKKIRR
jgi:hypothetical protein